MLELGRYWLINRLGQKLGDCVNHGGGSRASCVSDGYLRPCQPYPQILPSPHRDSSRTNGRYRQVHTNVSDDKPSIEFHTPACDFARMHAIQAGGNCIPFLDLHFRATRLHFRYPRESVSTGHGGAGHLTCHAGNNLVDIIWFG